jgi:hypothetical protein
VLKSLTVCLGGMSMRELARMVRMCGTALSELRACPLRVPGRQYFSVDSHITILSPHKWTIDERRCVERGKPELA